MNSSVRLGSKPHANSSAAITKSGKAIHTDESAASTAAAAAIPSVIVCFLVAIEKV
jgi:hypothetical protein